MDREVTGPRRGRHAPEPHHERHRDGREVHRVAAIERGLVDGIDAEQIGKQITVIARAAPQGVEPRAAREPVGPEAAQDRVGPGAAVEPVVLQRTLEPIPAVAPLEPDRQRAGHEAVVPRAADHVPQVDDAPGARGGADEGRVEGAEIVHHHAARPGRVVEDVEVGEGNAGNPTADERAGEDGPVGDPEGVGEARAHHAVDVGGEQGRHGHPAADTVGGHEAAAHVELHAARTRCEEELIEALPGELDGRIDVAVLEKQIGVVPIVAGEGVVAAAPLQRVVVTAARERVVVGAAVEVVVTAAARERVDAPLAVEPVGPAVAGERVTAGAAEHVLDPGDAGQRRRRAGGQVDGDARHPRSPATAEIGVGEGVGAGGGVDGGDGGRAVSQHDLVVAPAEQHRLDAVVGERGGERGARGGDRRAVGRTADADEEPGRADCRHVDRVGAAARRLDDRVRARGGEDVGVVVGTADDLVRAGAGQERVVARVARERVVAFAAVDPVGACAAHERVAATAAADHGAAGEGAGENHVVTDAAGQDRNLEADRVVEAVGQERRVVEGDVGQVGVEQQRVGACTAVVEILGRSRRHDGELAAPGDVDHDDRVVAGAADGLVALRVAAAAGHEQVGAIAAVEIVRVGPAEEQVVAPEAADGVLPVVAVGDVGGRSAVDRVDAGVALDPIEAAAAAPDRVVAVAAADHVSLEPAIEKVVPTAAP